MLEEHRYTKNLERLESERDEALEDAQAWRRIALDARKAIVDALAARDDTAPEIMERKLRKALEVEDG